MEKINIFLKGSYKNNLIKLIHLKNKTNPNKKCILFVHGLFGLTGDTASKSKILGENLSSDYDIFYHNSSRNWTLYNKEKEYINFHKSFTSKKFEDSLFDLRQTLDYIHSQNYSNVTIIANSMGGSLVSYLASEYKEIKNIILGGSGIKASRNTGPILNSYPSEKIIKEQAEKYTGKVILIRGTDDTVVTKDNSEKLFKSFENASSSKFINLAGLNHYFGLLNGKKSFLAKAQYIESVLTNI